MDQFRIRKGSTKTTSVETEPSPLFLARRYQNEHNPTNPRGTSSSGSPSHISPRTQQKHKSDTNSNSTPGFYQGSIKSSDSGHPLNVSDWNEKVFRESNTEPLPVRQVSPPCPPREGFEWVWFPAGYCKFRGLNKELFSFQNSLETFFCTSHRCQLLLV